MLRAASALAVLASAAVHADTGVYIGESIGVGLSRDELAGVIGQPMHIRVMAGVRLGNVAIEPWILGDLQQDRDGAWRGIVGGEPAMGSADLEHYGIDGKYILPLDARLSAYVRGGPSIVAANGALEGYRGYGFGVAGGLQLSGRVRALGFLWSPLFFLNKGPKVTGALFLDQGWDFFRLRKPGAPPIHSRIGHVSVGFAVGSAF